MVEFLFALGGVYGLGVVGSAAITSRGPFNLTADDFRWPLRAWRKVFPKNWNGD